MHIPADVPSDFKELYKQNYTTLTKNKDRIFIFAGDQKIEHLHRDFFGPHIHQDAAHPEHLFAIAATGHVGAFATHLGLINQYGSTYPLVPYIAKLNGKTDIIDKSSTSSSPKADPLSAQLWSVEDVVTCAKESNLNIIGVGYTVYLGSEFEPAMLQEAAQIVLNAHQHGLLAILWIYPRSHAIECDTALDLLAGAAGVANALGADVVKIKTPEPSRDHSIVEQLQIIQNAAGSTKVVCAGGKQVDAPTFLEDIKLYIEQGNLAGVAIGRNIFQYARAQAIEMTKKIAQIVYGN